MNGEPSPACEVKGAVRLWFKETGGMGNPPDTGYPCSYGGTGAGAWPFRDRRRADSGAAGGAANFRLWPLKSNTGCLSPQGWPVTKRELLRQWPPCRGSVPRAAPGTAALSTSWAGGPGRAALALGELWRDPRAAATSAYCCSSLRTSGLSGETGRASPSGSAALGDEALCLPLLVDSREGPWEPGYETQATENQSGGETWRM